MTARKPPAKRTPAKKRAPRKRTAKKAEAKPGPISLVARGFTYDPATGFASWSPKSYAAEVLAALSIGATIEHAAGYAKVAQQTPRNWILRGRAAFGGHETLEAYAATEPDAESLAYAAFFLASSNAMGSPVVGALDQIDRARRAGEWRAGLALLKILPQARPYTETVKAEISGPDGGPFEVTVEERAQSLADQAALFLAGAAAQAEAQAQLPEHE